MTHRENLFYEGKKTDKISYNLTIKFFARKTFNNETSLDKADEDQVELLI